MIDIISTPILITMILGTVGLIIPIIDAMRKERGVNHQTYGSIASGALLVSIFIIIFRVFNGEELPIISFVDTSVLTEDMFGSFFAIVMLIVAIMVTISSIEYMRKTPNPAPYYSLLLLSSIGMVLLAYSSDLVMLIVAWELMSIPTYVLTGFHKNNPVSNEAAIKYFIFGALSTGIIIYGISLAYGLTGSTNIAVVLQGLVQIDGDLRPIAMMALAMFIAGFGFKMALVPFHMWLPDAYEGAPTTISAFLAAATKKAGFVAAFRVIILGMVALNLEWSLVLAILAILTMVIGNLAALTQKSMTRMLAYSSIGHAGYMLIGLSLAPFSHLAMQGSLFHILNHAVMKSAAFIASAAVIVTLATSNIDSYKGLGKRMPITALVMSISLLALAGVPPLNGFWSKFILFASSIDAGSTVSWAPALAIAGILTSALSLGYYALVIRKMYFEESVVAKTKRVKEPKIILVVLLFALVFMVGFGIYPTPLIEFSSISVPLTAELP
ncbi:MAG: NADH-quinone oxidoreductase subunit N [Thaumarchaeota archaeon]|nr:NADH-quinone oxidoreductase subunit N [Nitrososphaerota archaeon]